MKNASTAKLFHLTVLVLLLGYAASAAAAGLGTSNSQDRDGRDEAAEPSAPVEDWWAPLAFDIAGDWSLSGNLGVGTDAPVVDIHNKSGNTPTLRLEQDGTSGFTPQNWDVAGNEANFFVRDLTGGSTLPFRIRPGAPSSAIDVSASGDVGFGIANPLSAIHIQRATGEPNIRLETADTAGVRFELVNAGGEWEFIHGPGGAFNFNRVGVVGNQFIFTTNGNMVIQGTLSQSSSRTTKRDISPVESGEILAKVAELPLSSWSYKSDNARHVGPMAEDFWAAFDLGTDEKHLAPGDVAGVALAGVQGLNENVTELDEALKELHEALAEMRETLKEKDQRTMELEQELEELKNSFAKFSSVAR